MNKYCVFNAGSIAIHRGPADPNFREKTVAKARRNSSILMDEGTMLDLASVSLFDDLICIFCLVY